MTGIERYAVFIGLVAVIFIACGCAGYEAASDNKSLIIVADRQNYTPLMSSTVGIGLTPVFSSAVDNDTVSFQWHTDHGYFLSWGAPDFKVYNNGTDVTTSARKVYWSYSPEDMGKDKPPVHVTLTIVDKASGKAIGSSGIEIGWENKSNAVIKNN